MGGPATEDDLSALDLSCSDQLKPSPERFAEWLDTFPKTSRVVV